MDAERFEDETYEAVSVTQTWRFRGANRKRRIRLPSGPIVGTGTEYISYTHDAPVEASVDQWNIEREQRYDNDRRMEEYAS